MKSSIVIGVLTFAGAVAACPGFGQNMSQGTSLTPISYNLNGIDPSSAYNSSWKAKQLLAQVWQNYSPSGNNTNRTEAGSQYQPALYGNGSTQYQAPQYVNENGQYGNGVPDKGSGSGQYASSSQYANEHAQYGNGAVNYGNGSGQIAPAAYASRGLYECQHNRTAQISQNGGTVQNLATQNLAGNSQFPQVSLSHMLDEADQNWQNTPVAHPVLSQGYPAAAPGIAGAFAPLGGMRQPLQSGPPPFSPQNLLRIFLGGGTGESGGFGAAANSAQKQSNDASATGQAEALLQRARDQMAQAESDAERARYGDERQSAASSAQYHANDAREAADTAASITYSGPEYAKDYAAQARDAANRAQEAAERARYNAEQ